MFNTCHVCRNVKYSECLIHVMYVGMYLLGIVILDRWWSSLGASLSCVVGDMLSERVGFMHTCMHYLCVSVQNGVSTCCAYVGNCEKGFVWSNWGEKLTYMKPKDAWRHRQGSASMKRFAGLSLIPASQFVAWVSLLFVFPSSVFSVL